MCYMEQNRSNENGDWTIKGRIETTDDWGRPRA